MGRQLATMKTTLFLGILLASSPSLAGGVFSGPPVPLNTITHFIYVPLVRQATDYTCGVAALQSVLGYYGEDNREDQLSLHVKPNRQEGTLTVNIINYVKSIGYSVDAASNMTVEMLESAIDQGRPVLTLIQAWPAHPPVDWANTWEDGHFVVVIGYDEHNLYFMDPSTLGNYAYIPKDEFLLRWHDEDGRVRVTHYGMIIYKPTPAFNFNNVVPLD